MSRRSVAMSELSKRSPERSRVTPENKDEALWEAQLKADISEDTTANAIKVLYNKALMPSDEKSQLLKLCSAFFLDECAPWVNVNVVNALQTPRQLIENFLMIKSRYFARHKEGLWEKCVDSHSGAAWLIARVSMMWHCHARHDSHEYFNALMTQFQIVNDLSFDETAKMKYLRRLLVKAFCFCEQHERTGNFSNTVYAMLVVFLPLFSDKGRCGVHARRTDYRQLLTYYCIAQVDAAYAESVRVNTFGTTAESGKKFLYRRIDEQMQKMEFKAFSTEDDVRACEHLGPDHAALKAALATIATEAQDAVVTYNAEARA